MPGYPTSTDIEINWRKSGAGVCIIVEGETEQEDSWFYGQWFGNRAKEVTFFPQNGWTRVIDAVTALRATLGNKCVYGIIDRDFIPAVAYPPIPVDGILRTQKYTLENYLLDPDCWFQYIRRYIRRHPRSGWNTTEEVGQTVNNLYRECIPLAAYNLTLRQVRDLDYTAFTALPGRNKEYVEHPQQIHNLGDVSNHFRQIQIQMNLIRDLGQMYLDAVQMLENSPSTILEQIVSGKYVLKQLSEQFPLGFAGRQAWDDILGAYTDTCPDPPEDLRNLVDLILQDAHS